MFSPNCRAILYFFLIQMILVPLFAQNPYSNLKIAPPPQGGVYIGQYEWMPGHVDTLEMTIQQPTAWFSRQGAMDINNEGFPTFDPIEAEIAWQDGKIIIANAIEAITDPLENTVANFTVDKLLQGVYDTTLTRLAGEFREFSKPMFFITAREPLGIGFDYMGGFGSVGDKNLEWALVNNSGFAEFDPNSFPYSFLYTDLGDPTVSDGVERLVAAQRYYHYFFTELEDLKFLTFETMGYPAGFDAQSITAKVDEYLFEIPGLDSLHVRRIMESSIDFENYYPGDDFVDWVSINFYTVDYYAEDWTGLEEDVLFSTEYYLDKLDYTLNRIQNVASNKPVFFLEFGLPDGRKKDSPRAASRVDSVFQYLLAYGNSYNVHGISFWSLNPYWFVEDIFPFDCLVRPGTAQGNKLWEIVNANPGYFNSCVYLSDGSRIPTCSITGIEDNASNNLAAFRLEQNYPNPFNPETRIAFELNKSANISLDVFDIMGRHIETLFSGQLQAGLHSITWSAGQNTSGVYLYHLTDGKSSLMRKMILVR